VEERERLWLEKKTSLVTCVLVHRAFLRSKQEHQPVCLENERESGRDGKKEGERESGGDEKGGNGRDGERQGRHLLKRSLVWPVSEGARGFHKPGLGLGCRVEGSGFRVQSSWFRI
jgi:hypothetical protein